MKRASIVATSVKCLRVGCHRDKLKVTVNALSIVHCTPPYKSIIYNGIFFVTCV